MVLRKAQIGDAKTIQGLVNAYAQKGEMLPLSLQEIYEALREFSVAEEDGEIVGACALHICWEFLGEIRSLAVRVDYVSKGIGRRLVEEKLREAVQLGLKKVFVLTYRGDFFAALKFIPIDKNDLPHKVWADCVKCVKFPDCDESAFIYELSGE